MRNENEGRDSICEIYVLDGGMASRAYLGANIDGPLGPRMF
jgi:hypothetical protein